jgi:hypothetical protein
MSRSKQVKEGHRRRPKVVSGGPVRLTSTKKLHADPALESASRNSSNNLGILRPDTPKEVGDVRPSALFPGRIMLTITILALIFITIITWFVSRMPAK